MTKKFFGTDGVRGTANAGNITPEKMLKLGLAVARVGQRGEHRHQVVIGKDTRLSGYMIENALTSGLVAGGMDVAMVGPVPTPAVGMLTVSLRADMGIMITASHNPFTDNGVKLFGPDGFKLSDKDEREIERLLDLPMADLLAASSHIGRATTFDDARARYVEAAKRTFPRELSLDGLKIGIDAANGSGYKTLPAALWELGAEIVTMGVSPNGENINLDCGSMHPERLGKLVVEESCDIGIALDGDADRLIVVDETGRVIDGDQILGLIALELKQAGQLKGGGVVATVMSNLGLEQMLESEGLELARTKVGDRYVVARMRAEGYNLGGEQSGHIVLSDHATTGDGLVAALQVLAAMVRREEKASACLSMFDAAPQRLINVRYGATDPLESDTVKAAIADVEARLGKDGRLVIRKSGTEPLIRVMVEALDEGVANSEAETLASLVEREGA